MGQSPGGTDVVLGPVCPVVGSGMAGGLLYLLDEDRVAEKLHDDVTAAPLDEGDGTSLRALLEEHARETGSPRAQALLADWPAAAARFVRVAPRA